LNTTDIQNSLLKFHDLQDFYARTIIVMQSSMKNKKYSAFDVIKGRVNFLGYDMLVKQYEHEMFKPSQSFAV